MTAPELVNTLLSGLVLAAIYSLITMGYVVVFRASHVFNFANPDLMLVGGLVLTTFASGGQVGVAGFAVAVLVAVVACATVGAGAYATVVHRSLGQPHWVQMVLTMGLAAVMLNLAQIGWGSDLRIVSLPFDTVVWRPWSGVVVTSDDLLVLGVCGLVAATMYLVLGRTRLGLRLRAAAEDPELAGYHGVDVLSSFTLVWAMAAGAAALAGIAYSIRVPLSPSIVSVGLVAFPASMIGGMDSIGGALVGALILALVQQVATALVGTQAAIALSFAVVLVVLVVRPQGLFGSRTVERV